MKIPVRTRASGPRFNITPMVDICFNLIVFFGLASLCVKKETAEPVALPDSSQFDRGNPSAPRRLVITLNAAGRVFVGGDELDRDGAARILVERCGENPSGLEVRIRADKAVPYREIKPLLMACARAGVTDLKFAVQAR